MALSSSAVHSSRETLVRYRRRLQTTDPPGNTYPTHRLNLQGKTLSHRLILTSQVYTYAPPGNTYLRASIFLAILTSGNTSAHVRGPGSKRAWSSHQAFASIRLAPHHAAWSRHMNDASRVPTLHRGVAPDVTGTTLPSLFSFWDDPLLTKGVVPPNVIVVPPQTSRRTRGSILTISRTPMPRS
ncbi:hypothetical protein DPMN_126185 [Dreissena polymorpha]|uniref:Uncharacterized protein n=1 Tax=Dreissena polymorpha TaxID=45954 RepID=A0A9D4GWJ9_DREPO|nr:hypothetical protein DPMN_126185 [Dreissena polymorpha]